MALSKWPDHFKDKPEPRGPSVVVTFDPPMFVYIVNHPKSIGLKGKEEDREVDLWIPISQITEKVPKQGTWISSLQITKWFSDTKGLEYGQEHY